MKKFEEIKTADELIRYTMTHGIPCDEESVCRMQDIIGHTAIEELNRLANDNGRNDENGKPDPKGSFSSGRRSTINAFYALIFSIWHWEDAVRFWNQNSNAEHAELKDLRSEVDKLAKHNEHLSQRRGELIAQLDEAEEMVREKAEETRRLTEQTKAQAAEIQELKAKLYDLITTRE